MDKSSLKDLHSSITTAFKAKNYRTVATNLNKAKLYLVTHNLLFPSPSAPKSDLLLARDVLEIGALNSIHQINKVAFRRYHAQLQPFYDDASLPKSSNQEKMTGLYLLLLLSENETAEFHTVLEVLGGEGDWGEYVKYPVMLERWLMEGSYDKIWEATRGKTVPSEEFGLFSKVMVETIRNEIALCSERAYPSLPISNAKNLLFLGSDAQVVDFAKKRGWNVRDGRIYFPDEEGISNKPSVTSRTIIENTIGYGNELETIV